MSKRIANKKISKIVNEVLLYLLNYGFFDVELKVKLTKKMFTLQFSLTDVKQEIINYMDHKINQPREIEMEEYGWEIMGESSESNELEMVGLLVDDLIIEREENITHFTIKRKC